MYSTEQEKTPVITSEVDRDKVFKSLEKITKPMKIVAMIIIPIGLLITVVGINALNELSPYAGDFESFCTAAMPGIGIIALIAGVLSLFLPKKMVASAVEGEALRVYEDHIEGKSIRVSGAAQGKMEFYEPYDKISGVSITDTGIAVNLKNGDSLRCIAANAQELAQAIRARLK